MRFHDYDPSALIAHSRLVHDRAQALGVISAIGALTTLLWLALAL